MPFLDIAFGTAPLAFDPWLVCAAMASVVVIYSELQKLLRRNWGDACHSGWWHSWRYRALDCKRSKNLLGAKGYHSMW